LNILALDLGTTTGWCAGNREANIHGIWRLMPGRFDSASMRVVKFLQALNDIHASMPIGAVYYEEVRSHRGVDAAHWYGAYWSHLIKWCDEHGIPHEGVPVGEIKKSWTGKGNAPKKAMIAEAQRRGLGVEDENEVDAIALFTLKAPAVAVVPGVAKKEAA
jgi:crossover junction endodeoxyribonuclease RuvC